MATPAQMFDNELNGVKGFYPGQPWIVDKAVDLDSSVDETTVKAGMVAHIDTTSGDFKLGTGTTTAQSAPMPFILFQNGTDFDVVGDDGNFVGQGSATPRLMGLATCQGAEVESTAYDSGTYTSGDLLVSGADGNLEIVGASGAATICGVVSDGEVTSEHSNAISLLRFHTVFQLRFS